MLHKSSVAKICKKDRIESKKGCGRPRSTSVPLDRRIVSAVRKDAKITRTQIRSTLGVGTSNSTMTRRFREAGLNMYKPAKKPFISAVNVQKRLDWARKHIGWTVSQWRKVIFVDEADIRLFRDYSSFVRRPRGKRHDPKYTLKTMKFGGGPPIIVFEAIAYGGLSYLRVFHGTLDFQKYRMLLDLLKQPRSAAVCIIAISFLSFFLGADHVSARWSTLPFPKANCSYCIRGRADVGGDACTKPGPECD